MTRYNIKSIKCKKKRKYIRENSFNYDPYLSKIVSLEYQKQVFNTFIRFSDDLCVTQYATNIKSIFYSHYLSLFSSDHIVIYFNIVVTQ